MRVIKRVLHTNMRAVGRGINRGGVKNTVAFPGYRGKRFGAKINNAIRIRGRR